jgi:hypothetical protein
MTDRTPDAGCRTPDNRKLIKYPPGRNARRDVAGADCRRLLPTGDVIL